MTDLTMTRLHEAIVLLYGIALILYFIDYIKKEPRAHRIAFWFVSIVWVLQTIFLIMYIVETQRFPILSLFEGVYFYAWLLVSISIALHCFYHADLPVFFINVIGFVFMVVHTFAPTQIAHSPVGESLVSELLWLHIFIAILSYAAFAVSFVFSILYLLLYNMLKKKQWTKQWTRLPSLQQAETTIMWAVYIGVPLLLISLILGIQWSYVSFGTVYIFDVKTIFSIIAFIAYSCIIYLNLKGKLYSTNYVRAILYTFILLLANFFFGNSLSQFHFWY